MVVSRTSSREACMTRRLQTNLAKQLTISSVGKEPLQDQVEGGDLDELYLGSITVGKRSGQTFSCDFDTGSADLFVPGPKCDTSQGCPGTTKYNQGGTDEKSTTTITYGSGMVTGENFYDSVTVSGLTAAHQNVISLTQATGFSGSDASSLMGMAFSSIAQSRKPTYFETLMAQNIVTTPEFSFYLGRVADGTQGNSELTLGGRNTAKFSGPVTMVPVTSQTYWQVAIDGVAVAVAVTQLLKPVSVAGTSGQAAIDTGTTLIIAPTQAAANIYKSIPGSFEVSLLGGPAGFYAYPCALKPNVQLQFNGVKLAINPKDFSFGTLTTTFANFMGSSSLANVFSNGQYCLGAIVGADIYAGQNFYVVVSLLCLLYSPTS